MRSVAILTARLAAAAAVACAAAACDTLSELTGPGEPESRSVEGVTTDVAAIIGTFADGPMNRPYLIESLTEFERYYGDVDAAYEASYHVRAFFQNGGRRIWVLRVSAATDAALVGNGLTSGGLASLNEANRFNQLLVPELFTAPAVANRSFAAAAAIAYAASRGAMMLLDAPAEATSTQSAIDWVAGSSANLRDPHAVMYYGRIQVPDGAGGGATRWIGASGAAAGIYAANDRERGVWASPAGQNSPALAGVLGVQPLTATEMSDLTVAGINPVRDGPARLWGARTMAGADSEFIYIAVQRLTLYIDLLVRSELGWTAGHSMDQDLWQQVQAGTEQLLHGLWQDGAFEGLQPQEGYFVRCDASTHTQADIEAGRLNVVIGFAPLRPAEFIVRRITIQL
jgi:uncharacterized protein